MVKQRLILVDDHEVVRLGLKSLLERHAQFDIIGEASTAREAIETGRSRCDSASWGREPGTDCGPWLDIDSVDSSRQTAPWTDGARGD